MHAFRTAANRPINPATDDLGTLGGPDSVGISINNFGQVTGYSFMDSLETIQHAFRTAANRPMNPATDDLGTLGGPHSVGMSINDFGQVVGYSFIDRANTIQHAFLVNTKVMDDLNNLIPKNQGWELQVAYGINDLGQIVGVGARGSDLRPFLLTPAFKELCQNGGWKTFGFKNQGQCIQFANTGK